MLTTKQGENPYIWKNSNGWFNCFKTSQFVQIIKNKMSDEKGLHYSCTCLYFKYFTSCWRSNWNLCKAFALYHSQTPVRSNSFLKVGWGTPPPPIFFFWNSWLTVMIFWRIISDPLNRFLLWRHTTLERHCVWMNPCNCFHNCPKTTTVTVTSIR
jgi:hypothetical protein